MKQLRKRPFLKITVAACLLLLGVTGVILPIVPGLVFVGLGLYILSVDSPRVQGVVCRYRARHGILDTALKHSYDKLHAKNAAIEEVV